MIFYKNREWHICTEKVRYTQHNQEITQHVGAEGKEWWIDFADKWEHTEIIEFKDVIATQDQLSRLEEINRLDIGEGYREILGNYVANGKFPEGYNHPLKNLKLEKENLTLSNYVLDVDMRLTMKELGL